MVPLYTAHIEQISEWVSFTDGPYLKACLLDHSKVPSVQQGQVQRISEEIPQVKRCF